MIATFVYAASINLITYVAFAWDKRLAITRARRIPEARLLFWAAAGGWPAAKLAQHRLRHKSTKQPFGWELNNIGIVQALIAATLMSVIAALAFTNPDFSTVAAPSSAGPPDVTPAGPLPHISLRPPAGRPAMY
ncbi:DUF1294 domain-containing protein [Sulfitobacter guttiformis]|uniref:DUF1294 domain-containing protein n=1 Tax=Sulfitobacter guttiformis TaxID=74349 RepID=UPI001474ED4E